jgi:hypothetical protein
MPKKKENDAGNATNTKIPTQSRGQNDTKYQFSFFLQVAFTGMQAAVNFAPAGATRGLSARPLDPSGPRVKIFFARESPNLHCFSYP